MANSHSKMSIKLNYRRPITDPPDIGKELKDYWKEDPNADLAKDWINRYFYEAAIIMKYDFKSLLDVGSGPGGLCQMLIQNRPNVVYHMIDTESAEKIHKERNYMGKFFVKDLENNFFIDDLLGTYDMIVMNDFLEHIRNPSLIMTELYGLMNEKSRMIISIPNWRMGHGFIYPGLFDFDNIITFFYQHRYKLEIVYDSPIKCTKFDKLQSESGMPDGLITSWNWYFVGSKK